MFSGVDFQVKTIRIDMKNIALQLWDTAGKYEYKQQHNYYPYTVYICNISLYNKNTKYRAHFTFLNFELIK